MQPRELIDHLPAIGVGIAGALLAVFLRVPIRWMLGALFACAAATAAGLPIRALPNVVECWMRVAIGVSLGPSVATSLGMTTGTGARVRSRQRGAPRSGNHQGGAGRVAAFSRPRDGRTESVTRRPVAVCLLGNNLANPAFHASIARMIARRLRQAVMARLEEMPAVALLGPRQAGKTTLALQIALEAHVTMSRSCRSSS